MVRLVYIGTVAIHNNDHNQGGASARRSLWIMSNTDEPVNVTDVRTQDCVQYIADLNVFTSKGHDRSSFIL